MAELLDHDRRAEDERLAAERWDVQLGGGPVRHTDGSALRRKAASRDAPSDEFGAFEGSGELRRGSRCQPA
jgi:hypothetical protein